MTVYQGHNDGGNTASPHLVTVTVGDDTRLLEHRVHHSPTGFSWGYAGSGPSDLARSILWDHLGSEPTPNCYHDFKFDFVAGWPQDDGWVLTGEQIDRWLAEYQAGGGIVSVAEYEAWLAAP